MSADVAQALRQIAEALEGRNHIEHERNKYLAEIAINFHEQGPKIGKIYNAIYALAAVQDGQGMP